MAGRCVCVRGVDCVRRAVIMGLLVVLWFVETGGGR